MTKYVVLLATIAFIAAGCDQGSKIKTKTIMYQYYEDGFDNFSRPDIGGFRDKAEFPHVTFDEAWDAAIVVLMQGGVILHASRETGSIVGMGKWPLAVYIERRDPINVHLRVLTGLYNRADDPSKTSFDFRAVDLKAIYKNFYQKLATQVFARQKWEYLVLGDEI